MSIEREKKRRKRWRKTKLQVKKKIKTTTTCYNENEISQRNDCKVVTHKPKIAKGKPKIRARRIIRFRVFVLFGRSWKCIRSKRANERTSEWTNEKRNKNKTKTGRQEKFHMSCIAYLSHIVAYVLKLKRKHTHSGKRQQRNGMWNIFR